MKRKKGAVYRQCENLVEREREGGGRENKIRWKEIANYFSGESYLVKRLFIGKNRIERRQEKTKLYLAYLNTTHWTFLIIWEYNVPLRTFSLSISLMKLQY